MTRKENKSLFKFEKLRKINKICHRKSCKQNRNINIKYSPFFLLQYSMQQYQEKKLY